MNKTQHTDLHLIYNFDYREKNQVTFYLNIGFEKVKYKPYTE